MSELRFKNMVLREDKRDRYEDALSDVICWLDGFTSAGKDYQPNTLHILKEIQSDMKSAYDTTPPTVTPRPVEPNYLELVRQIRFRAIQAKGAKPAIAQQKLEDIRQIADAIFELPKPL